MEFYILTSIIWVIVYFAILGYSFFIINDKIIFVLAIVSNLLWLPFINKMITDYGVIMRIREKYPEEFAEDSGLNLRPRDLEIKL